ncbi:S8 family serine peptidase [Novosphingobium bradum]|uniref:S8 family serine peptidase n=1 Tax=Novosphingobium bradum TaxID=1737444 RepID=A0ABV7IPT4_9SPHN
MRHQINSALRLSAAAPALSAALACASPALADDQQAAPGAAAPRFGVEAVAQPRLAALDASNPNLAEWSLINLTAADLASASGGAGIKVALLDGVTDCRDTDLAGHCTYTLLSGGTYKYYSNHGTHTAGIVAGARYGIAPSATITNYAVFDDRGFVATGAKLVNTWKAAYSGGARIASMSFGCTRMALCFSASEVSAMADARQPILFVKAAGNDGAGLVNESIAVSSATANAALNRLLLVGSVSATGTISTFSNRPGEACLMASGSSACAESLKWKNHFLVAPGESIYSTLPGNLYGFMSGTSMATPAVAGVAALLQQRWPTLKSAPETLARILLTSATDLGAPGVDGVYGYGLLNVARAFQANGTITLATTSGSSVTLSGTTISSTSAMLSKLVSALGKVTVFDGFGRDYTLAETGAVRTTGNFLAARQMLGRRLLGTSLEDWSAAFFADQSRARGFAFTGAAGDPLTGSLNLDRTMRMGVDLPIDGGLVQVRLTGAGDPRQDFAQDPTMRPLAQFASTSLLRGALIGGVNATLPGQARLMVYGVATGGMVAPDYGNDLRQLRVSFDGYTPRAALGHDGSPHPARSGLGMGVWKQIGSRTVVGVNASAIIQANGYHSITSDLAMFRKPSRTFNFGLAGYRQLGGWGLSLSVEASHLRTGWSDGLTFTPATLVSGEFGIRRKGLAFRSGTGLADSLALALTVPPRAIAGQMRVDYLAPTPDGLDLRSATVRAPISALGHDPVRMETAYRIGTGDRWSLEITGGINLEHIDGLAPIEGMVSFRLPL